MKVEKKYKQLLKDYEKIQQKNAELKSELKKYKQRFAAINDPDNEKAKAVMEWREATETIQKSEVDRQKQFDSSMNELKAKQMECDILLKQLRIMNKHLKENENTT